MIISVAGALPERAVHLDAGAEKERESQKSDDEVRHGASTFVGAGAGCGVHIIARQPGARRVLLSITSRRCVGSQYETTSFISNYFTFLR